MAHKMMTCHRNFFKQVFIQDIDTMLQNEVSINVKFENILNLFSFKTEHESCATFLGRINIYIFIDSVLPLFTKRSDALFLNMLRMAKKPLTSMYKTVLRNVHLEYIYLQFQLQD